MIKLKKYLVALFSILLCSMIVTGSTSASERLPNQKRAIHAGWDMPTTEYMRKNWREMDQIPAFDGFMFRVVGTTDDGKNVTSTALFTPEPWKLDWFDQARKDLAECRFQNMKHNFLMIYATPGSLNWNDADGWKNLCEKVGFMAKIAKEGGAVGLCLDFESYGKQQFKFDSTQGLTWEEMKTLARRYGRDFMTSVAKEFPDAVLLTYWMNSLNMNAGKYASPDTILKDAGYGLMPYFYDGMLDVIPPKMTMVDGCEFYFLQGDEFTRVAHQIRQWNGACARLVSPENRAKYRAQVQVGFGFYLDMYINPEGNIYYRGPMDNGGSRFDRLAWNLQSAFAASDEYVWVYGEKCRWFGAVSCNEFQKAPHKDYDAFGLSWESQLPGLTQRIAWLKNPETACAWKLKQLQGEAKDGKLALVNLIENAEFTDGRAGRMPEKYGFWQLETHATGNVAFDPNVTYLGSSDGTIPASAGGSCRMEKMYNGCLITHVNVKPGEHYYVRLKCKKIGDAQPSLCIRWQTEEGHWTHENFDDVTCSMKPLDDGSGWMMATGAIQVPNDCYKLVPLLSVHFQADESQVWLDDMEVFKME